MRHITFGVEATTAVRHGNGNLAGLCSSISAVSHARIVMNTGRINDLWFHKQARLLYLRRNLPQVIYLPAPHQQRWRFVTWGDRRRTSGGNNLFCGGNLVG